MSDSIQNPQLTELLIDRATVGLNADEQSELQRRLDNAGIADDFTFDGIVALLQETFAASDMKPLPDHIRAQVLVDADRVVSAVDGESLDDRQVQPESRSRIEPQSATGQRIESSVNHRREMLAWLAAAASLLLAAFLWLGAGAQTPDGLISLSNQSEWDRFVSSAKASDLFQVDLDKGNYPSGSKPAGTVVWNRKTKRGLINVTGLAKNNPAEQQYQLWVIDRERGFEDRPNAGVFDIPNAGQNILEFHSDLEVFDAKGFAITLEKPGGINKSDLSKIALVHLGTP